MPAASSRRRNSVPLTVRSAWCAGGALAVHAQRDRLPVHVVGFQLRQVVGHVVNQVEPRASRPAENRAGLVGKHVPVGASVVGGCSHRGQVTAAFEGADRRAGQLTVGHGDAIARHGLVHDPHVVATDLMAQAAGTAVDHDADLAAGQPESARSGRVVDLVHRLHLQEVVGPPRRV